MPLHAHSINIPALRFPPRSRRLTKLINLALRTTNNRVKLSIESLPCWSSGQKDWKALKLNGIKILLLQNSEPASSHFDFTTKERWRWGTEIENNTKASWRGSQNLQYVVSLQPSDWTGYTFDKVKQPLKQTHLVYYRVKQQYYFFKYLQHEARPLTTPAQFIKTPILSTFFY